VLAPSLPFLIPSRALIGTLHLFSSANNTLLSAEHTHHFEYPKTSKAPPLKFHSLSTKKFSYLPTRLCTPRNSTVYIAFRYWSCTSVGKERRFERRKMANCSQKLKEKVTFSKNIAIVVMNFTHKGTKKNSKNICVWKEFL